MKRKYVALMLGLTLAFSSIAYAEEATEAVAVEAAGEMSEEEDALYGEITEIGEDSITVALGTMSVDEMQPAPGEGGAAEDTNAEADVSEETGAEVAEGDAEATDADTGAAEEADAEATDADASTAEEADAEVADAVTSAAEENADWAEAPEMDENDAPEGQHKGGRGMELELTGEEQTITITEDTLFYREAAMQTPEGELPETPAEEGAEMTDADTVSEEDSTVSDAAAVEDVAGEEAEVTADAEEGTNVEVTADAEEGSNVEVTAEEAGGELLVEISEKPEQQLEEISFEDLAEGDVLKITLDEDGNAETVTIVMTEPAEFGDAEMMAEMPEEEAGEAEIMTLEEVDTEEADVQTEAAE